MAADLQLLTKYKAWSERLLFAAVSEMPKVALTENRSIVFGSLLRTLNHVKAMDMVWQAHLVGESHGMTTRNPVDCPELEAIYAAQSELNDWYINYSSNLSVGQANESVEFSFIGGGPGAMTRAQIILHVVNHSTYHHGHVADMMYESGVTPPTTDLPVYLSQTETLTTSGR